MPRRTVHIDLDALTDEWADEVRLSEMIRNLPKGGIEALARQSFQEGVYRGAEAKSQK